MERIFAIIPVKPLDDGKSRLRAVLDDAQRLAFNTFLMDRTFDLARDYPGPAQTIVVSRSRQVLMAARSRGFTAVEETGDDLNAALSLATRTVQSRNADGLFVLPVDLPLADAATIESIVRLQTPGSCLLVVDRRGTGTNFLFLSPPDDGFYRFGPESFRQHRIAAAERTLRLTILNDGPLTIDIDEADDFRLWQSIVAGDHSTS